MVICTGGLVAAHWLYWSDGIKFGPRFTFEATAALALLTARGAALLARADGSVPCETAVCTVALTEPESESDAPSVSDEPPAPVGSTVSRRLSAAPFVVLLVAALFAIDLIGYMPDVVLAYRDYNGVSRADLRVVEEAGLKRSVVFVSSAYPDWQSYGGVFLANGPFLNDEVIFARDLGETENWRLLLRYSERRGWLLHDHQLTEIRR
jgi:hypothetical protein